MDPRDVPRLTSNRARILAHLQAHGAATNVELRDIGGLRALGRVHELTKTYDIRVTRQSGGVWRISYHGPRRPGQQELFA